MTQGGRGCWLSWEKSWGERGPQVSRHSAPSAGPASIAHPPPPAHQHTVLLARLSGDGTDVGQLGGAQGAEEAGLAVLVAREEAVIRDHQAAGDAGAGSYPLGDDLKGTGRAEGRGKLELSRAGLHQDSPRQGPDSPSAPPCRGQAGSAHLRSTGADRGDGGNVRPQAALTSRVHSWAGPWKSHLGPQRLLHDSRGLGEGTLGTRGRVGRQ